jgi:hypothetical protein
MRIVSRIIGMAYLGHFRAKNKLTYADIGQPGHIPMKDGHQQTFQKDRHKIEFNICSPLVPNPISKLVATVHKSIASLGQQLKTHKLLLGLHLALKTRALLSG